MKSYNIDEVREIIKSKQKKNDIIITPHAKDRCHKRKIRKNYVLDSIINKVPLGNIKTEPNSFRLIYSHETDNTMDLHIIINVTDNRTVKVITLYPRARSWREHETRK